MFEKVREDIERLRLKSQSLMEETPTMTDTTRDYNNHTITLKDNWEFAVTGPEFDAGKYSISFKSFSDARND
jgi:hypothetical protein